MMAYVYIHAYNEIVEEYVVEIGSLDDIKKYLDDAIVKYGDEENFCFDVMII